MCMQVHSEKHIVVIASGEEEDVGSLVQGMADFAPTGSQITLISPDALDDLPDELGNCQFRHPQGSIASRHTLLQVTHIHMRMHCRELRSHMLSQTSSSSLHSFAALHQRQT